MYRGDLRWIRWILSYTYQKATTAWEETNSVPATMVFVSGEQATERTGACFATDLLALP